MDTISTLCILILLLGSAPMTSLRAATHRKDLNMSLGRSFPFVVLVEQWEILFFQWYSTYLQPYFKHFGEEGYKHNDANET